MKLAALAMTAALAAYATAAGAQDAAPAKNDYAKAENWLCWPGKAGDACAVDLTTTVVKADGSTSVEAFKADPNAPIDCFYVYPTVSRDPAANSDMVPGLEEKNVVLQQLARFGAKCRVYAPMYRQFTLTALTAMMQGRPMAGMGAASFQLGYNDVVDAWNHYLAHENKGRGVVLIGHSQGSGVLTQLIAAEIDGKPVKDRIVSALLMGTNLPVEAGKDTGQFKTLPLCRSASQTGCVIAYATFRDTVPPPADSLFGRLRNAAPGMEAACSNPASLAGGPGALHAYLGSGAMIVGAAPPIEWVKGGAQVTTPFVSVPGLLTAQCVNKDGANYLSVHVNADPADPRVDDIRGDLLGADGKPNAQWGLHLLDANIAMGNLVDLVGSQSKAYLSKK
jgi:pimeloyl-ACP methyl ester carboxylesterase